MTQPERGPFRAHEVSTTCQPPVNRGPSDRCAKQQEFCWDRAALAAAIERWPLVGVARRLWILADRELSAEALRNGHVDACQQVTVEDCTGIRILTSLRRLGRLLGCSQTAVDKAVIRLESLGLASRGSDRQGTSVVLWVSRLFDAPEVLTAHLSPPEKTVSAGVNPVSTGCQPPRPESEKKSINQICAESESESESKPRADFWTAKGLPWQRLTDADLEAAVAGELEILRVLWREEVKLGWLAADHVREFLAVCHHAATAELSHEYQGRTVHNPAVALVRSRLTNRHFRNLSEESYRFADQLLRRMEPAPEAVTELALQSLRDVEE